ncbi:DUF3352 domain-containing protein [Thalassoroseus pseudoceratinae]|uniref:DUF3352 domain-containing protein n=1 Tax=Thalassoroseus pseudoceratinae TaxID=2713176 RepID=UPI00142111CC|nr:DUF3352 domain-containing protein [Thalassoroseus pseudoceratinae]
MIRSLHNRIASFALGFGLIASALVHTAWAAEADLLRLVRPDVGLCMTASGWQPSVKKPSVWLERVKQSPLYQGWRSSRDYQKFRRSITALEGRLGQPAWGFFKDMTAGGVAVAVYPRPESEPVSILLLQASDSETLKTAVDLWNEMEHAVLETDQVGDLSYVQRTTSKSADQQVVQYYAHHGRLFVLTDDETTLRTTLQASANEGDDNLTTAAWFQTAQAALPEDCRVKAYFNPRAWDSAVQLPEHPKFGERQIFKLWQQCESIALGLRVQRGLSLEGVASFSSALAAKSTDNNESAFREHLPADAWFVYTGKVDLAGGARFLRLELPEKDRREFDNLRQIGRGFFLGHDVLDNVLPALGPHFGCYITPRADMEDDVPPIHGVFALEFEPQADANDNAVPVRMAIDRGLQTGWGVLAALVDTSARLRIEDEISWIDSLGPWQPAFSVTEDFLIFATDPESIQKFIAAKSQTDPPQAVVKLPTGPLPDQHVLVNLHGVRSFLADHENVFVRRIAANSPLSVEEVERRLRRAIMASEVFDSLFLTIDLKSDHVRMTVGGAVDTK